MVELRVIDGGLSTMPRELLEAIAGHHAMLAEICEGLAAYIDACPPDQLQALMARARTGFRRLARRYLEDMDEVLPECAALTKAARQHLRWLISDLGKAEPDQIGEWAIASRRAAATFGRPVS